MQIIRGKQQSALKVVVYGPEGVGKSTFAAQFPNPIFIDTEGSTGALDVGRVIPKSWTELLLDVDYFIAHAGELSTLIIDTADWAEKMCTEQVCSEHKWDGVEDAGYGKGYVYVAEEFGKLLNKLEQLKGAGVNVVLTAHAMMRKFEQPDEMNPYDRWELKLSKKCAPMVKEWSDLLLFANYKTFVVTSKDGQKSKATGGTKRMMYTEHTATYDAKNRFGLKPELPFDFAGIAHLVKANGQSMPVEAPATTTAKKAPVAPVQAPATEAVQTSIPMPEAPTAPQTPLLAGVPDALAALMAVNNVQVPELQAAVSQRGYYPANTPVENYDPKFIKGVLIGAWPQVENMILANREKAPF